MHLLPVIPEWFYQESKSGERKPSLFCHREERLRWRSRFSEPQKKTKKQIR